MQDDKFKLTKALTIILSFFMFIVIFFVFLSKSNPNYTLFFILTAGLVLIGSGIYFGTNYVQNKKENKINRDDVIPEPLGISQLKEKIKLIIGSFDYWNHLKRFGTITPYSFGKNLIYSFKIDLLYGDKNFGYSCFFLINANYPLKYSMLKKDSTNYAIKVACNALSKNPEDEPDIEKRTEVDLNLGKSVTYEKKTKKKVKPSEVKKEDIA